VVVLVADGAAAGLDETVVVVLVVLVVLGVVVVVEVVGGTVESVVVVVDGATPGGRLELDFEAARSALNKVGEQLGMNAESTAMAAIEIVDAHMSDAVRRVLSMAGADPRELDLVAFGGMGAVHAARQARILGMRRVLVPRSAPAFSALGLLTADHVIDDTRSLISDWREIDLERLDQLAADLEHSARAKFGAAGLPASQLRFDWRLNLVYPGQTFDVPIPVDRPEAGQITDLAVAEAVEELHRRNEAARLIEARSQEPVVRGIRLIALGMVAQPIEAAFSPSFSPRLLRARRVFAGDAWHDHCPVYDGECLEPGMVVTGPALVQSRFTTIVLAAADVATVLDNGDITISVSGT
jgi:N-methylhydantoinase A